MSAVVIVGGVLPLLSMYGVVTGYADVHRFHQESARLQSAQGAQQDADLMSGLIHADVHEALSSSSVRGVGEGSVQQSVREHVARLGDDLSRVQQFALPGDLGARSRGLSESLRAAGVQGVTLVDLAATDQQRAVTQLPAFDRAVVSWSNVRPC